MNKKINFLMIAAAAVLWGMIGLYSSFLSGRGYTNMQIIFLRSALTTVFMGIFLLTKDRKLFKIDIKDVWIFIGMGFLSFCMFNFFYFNAIKLNNSLSMACILMYTAPIFVMILSSVLFKEKITLQKNISLFLTIIGCVLVSGGNVSMTPLGLLAGLATGFGYSLYSIFGTYAVKKYSTYTSTFYAFLFSTIGSLFMCNPIDAVRITAESGVNTALFLSFAVINTALPYMLYTKGLEKIEASKAIIICCVEPVVATVLGVLVLKQSVGFISALGMLFVFAAIAILNIKFEHKTVQKRGYELSK